MTKPEILSIAYPPREYTLIPETETSKMMNGAKRLLWKIDLEKYDYVEEEYIISGVSNVYDWEDDEKYPHIMQEDCPYTSRIIVRRPRDPEKFSGIIHCDFCNPNFGYDRSNTGWAPCNEYIMSRGHGSVSFTISEISMEGLRKFDPERYGRLAFNNTVPVEKRLTPIEMFGRPIDETKENGVRFDFVSQVGALLKSDLPDQPFAGYNVKKIMIQSTTGGDLSAYIAAIHPQTKLPNGEPVFDGFLAVMTGPPGSLNNYRGMLHVCDPRNFFHSDVPFIHLNTTGDLLGGGYHPAWSVLHRREQCNEPGKYLRIYEVAGASVNRYYCSMFNPIAEDIERSGGKFPDHYNELPIEYPVHYVIRAMIDNLVKWMMTGEAPKICEYVEIKGEYPDTEIVYDEYGVLKGGMRSPYVDAPLYVYEPEGGIQRALTDEELKQLYTSKEDYLSKVTASLFTMLKNRYILPEDAEKVMQEAIEAKLPF